MFWLVSCFSVTSYSEKQLVCLLDSKTFWTRLIAMAMPRSKQSHKSLIFRAKVFPILSRGFRSDPLPGLRRPKFGTVPECGDMSPLSMREHVRAVKKFHNNRDPVWRRLQFREHLTMNWPHGPAHWIFKPGLYVVTAGTYRNYRI